MLSTMPDCSFLLENQVHPLYSDGSREYFKSFTPTRWKRGGLLWITSGPSVRIQGSCCQRLDSRVAAKLQLGVSPQHLRSAWFGGMLPCLQSLYLESHPVPWTLLLVGSLSRRQILDLLTYKLPSIGVGLVSCSGFHSTSRAPTYCEKQWKLSLPFLRI